LSPLKFLELRGGSIEVYGDKVVSNRREIVCDSPIFVFDVDSGAIGSCNEDPNFCFVFQLTENLKVNILLLVADSVAARFQNYSCQCFLSFNIAFCMAM
jgi:hypothetical protein